MRFNLSLGCLLLALILSTMPTGLTAAPADDSDFLGRWDVTVAPAGQGRARNCWLELTKVDGKLKGRFNQGGGAVFPLETLAIENGELKFQHPTGRPADKLLAVYSAHVVNGRLEGTATLGKQAPRMLTGIRPPKWPATPPARKPGKPIALFNGKDMTGWLGQGTGKAFGWTVKNGSMINDDHPAEVSADNIYTEAKFNDFKLEVEFNVAPKSNSGIYLRGRYEIQVMDDAGQPQNVHSQGALYGFVIPSAMVSKPAGEWQSYEITLIANRVTVILNGTKVIDNAEVPGITGGALDANEGEPGPIMLQGDHGPIQYRKVVLTPLN
ncbi:MAG TPA: DUF1080 domain-containing protein [Acidobacteriota bacterium]|nr:DUF1080 domain-containing protein [Acidobacteriota bacterium]